MDTGNIYKLAKLRRNLILLLLTAHFSIQRHPGKLYCWEVGATFKLTVFLRIIPLSLSKLSTSTSETPSHPKWGLYTESLGVLGGLTLHSEWDAVSAGSSLGPIHYSWPIWDLWLFSLLVCWGVQKLQTWMRGIIKEPSQRIFGN